MAGYSLTQFISVCLLYWVGTNLTDFQVEPRMHIILEENKYPMSLVIANVFDSNYSRDSDI